jgi:ABC-type lipoprotein export system ATPase subunit
MSVSWMAKEYSGDFAEQIYYETELIRLNNIVKEFRTAAGDFTALKNVNAVFQKGEFVSVVGKSGSGKSTLMNMITGIDHPTSGDVLVAGTNIRNMTESRRALWRGRNLGIVFQFFQLLPMLSLLENVMLPMDYCDVYPSEQREERAQELLRMVGLDKQVHKLPAAVSSGQQQSAAIARALATDPPIIVADEPTGNLDTRSAGVILDLFDNLVEQGKTILIVTHDPSLTRRTDRTLIISDGELVSEPVAAALPMLSHAQMLKATHLIRCIHYQPGATIIRQGEHNDYFFIVAGGQVEIVLKPRKEEVIVSRLGFGQFFGEVELLQGGRNIASIRAAADGPVDLVSLHREDFNTLLMESAVTQDYMAQVLEERIQENRTVSRRRKRV